ncbi:hypothetical protein CKO51_01820 [Rhodopirellula sp. SM50]|nr:hypothetical protein CKO51_01820 [Rhodopirellula sp. SM50]
MTFSPCFLKGAKFGIGRFARYFRCMSNGSQIAPDNEWPDRIETVTTRFRILWLSRNDASRPVSSDATPLPAGRLKRDNDGQTVGA